MKYIKIQNQGLLDIRLVSLMGGTTKEGLENKIGFFGTGLKYTLAYMMRNNLSLRIFIGENEVQLSSEIEVINEVEFRILYIDGQRTSITDKMGRDWKPWMILRECWSNAIDEGGHSRRITETVEGDADKTTFYFEMDMQFTNVWNNWNKYFIDEFEPLYSCPAFSIYPATDKPRIYKQGVLIWESDNDRKSIFNYDYKSAMLNELRELQTSVSLIMFQCITQLNDKKLITYFLENCHEETYEGKMDWDWEMCGKFNEAWKETIGTAKIIHQKAVENIKAKGLEIDMSGAIVVAQKVYKLLTKTFEGIGALRVANKVNEFYEIYDAKMEQKVKEALVILDGCGYYMHPELKFIYGDFGNKEIIAQVDLDKKEVMLSTQILTRSLFDLVATLIEENEHFNTGFSDKTRQFQQHFINLFAHTLLEKNSIKL